MAGQPGDSDFEKREASAFDAAGYVTAGVASAPPPDGGPSASPTPDAFEQGPVAVDQDDVDALLQAAGETAGDGVGSTSTALGASGGAAGNVQDSDPIVARAAAASAAKDGGTSEGSPAAVAPARAFDFPDFQRSRPVRVDAQRIGLLNDVNLRVKIQLGRAQMLVEDVLRLGEGSVVELDKLAGDPVDVFVNDRLVARGEVLVLNDSFCVRVSEVISRDPHRVSS